MCGSYHDVVCSATPQARQALAAKARLIANDFVTEVEVCCDLNHPHLVQFLGYAVQPQPMIVQELLRGSSVEHQLYTESWQPTPWQVSEEASSRALLNRQPRPAPAQLTTPPRLCSTDNPAPPRLDRFSQVLEVADGVASGMAYLHTAFSGTTSASGTAVAGTTVPEEGGELLDHDSQSCHDQAIIHRDLKSANLLLADAPRTGVPVVVKVRAAGSDLSICACICACIYSCRIHSICRACCSPAPNRVWISADRGLRALEGQESRSRAANRHDGASLS
jgi:serine/threonine protein kinase